MRPLTGKRVLITGASSGIGCAAAEAFGRQGCRLALLARGPEGLETAAARARARGAAADLLLLRGGQARAARVPELAADRAQVGARPDHGLDGPSRRGEHAAVGPPHERQGPATAPAAGLLPPRGGRPRTGLRRRVGARGVHRRRRRAVPRPQPLAAAEPVDPLAAPRALTGAAG